MRFESYHDYERCPHTVSRVTNRPAVNGQPRYWRQCLACGRQIAAMKQADALEWADGLPIPLFDEALYNAFPEAMAREAERKLAEQRAQRRAENDAWWASYNAYLASPAWAERRRRVLDRAQNMCEGCRLWPASQVHHLSYEHVGEELLWELVAVCDRCHDKGHQKREVG